MNEPSLEFICILKEDIAYYYLILEYWELQSKLFAEIIAQFLKESNYLNYKYDLRNSSWIFTERN